MNAQTQVVGDDRLKKAIERNRRKMAKKGLGHPPRSPFQATPSSGFTSYFKKDKNPHVQKQGKWRTNSSDVREGVARAQSFSFATPFKEISNRLPVPIEYGKKLSQLGESKWHLFKVKINRLIILFLWAFALFVLGRLLFAERGVRDYYQRSKVALELRGQLEKLKADNKLLEEEIQKLKSDSKYQKRIVREHLGVIADDEYLIVFSKEKE